MSPHDSPDAPDRPHSDAENAMAANARSRDRQGKAEDKARHDRAGLMAEGAKPRKHGQLGTSAARIGQGEADGARGSSVSPEARSISDARQDARDDERAADEGMAESRRPWPRPSSRP